MFSWEVEWEEGSSEGHFPGEDGEADKRTLDPKVDASITHPQTRKNGEKKKKAVILRHSGDNLKRIKFLERAIR